MAVARLSAAMIVLALSSFAQAADEDKALSAVKVADSGPWQIHKLTRIKTNQVIGCGAALVFDNGLAITIVLQAPQIARDDKALQFKLQHDKWRLPKSDVPVRIKIDDTSFDLAGHAEGDNVMAWNKGPVFPILQRLIDVKNTKIVIEAGKTQVILPSEVQDEQHNHVFIDLLRCADRFADPEAPL
jgi:hypothetical protein